MNIKPAGLFTVMLCLMLCACSSPAFQNQEQGWVLMNYVTNEETGVSGVEPVNLGEDVLIIQDAFPGTLEALIAEIKKDIASGALPEATGTYQGSGLVWQVYKGETQITDIGPINVILLMGLASDDEASYFVALVALPDSYAENSAKFDSVFYHTLYAFSPHP